MSCRLSGPPSNLFDFSNGTDVRLRRNIVCVKIDLVYSTLGTVTLFHSVQTRYNLTLHALCYTVTNCPGEISQANFFCLGLFYLNSGKYRCYIASRSATTRYLTLSTRTLRTLTLVRYLTHLSLLNTSDDIFSTPIGFVFVFGFFCIFICLFNRGSSGMVGVLIVIHTHLPQPAQSLRHFVLEQLHFVKGDN